MDFHSSTRDISDSFVSLSGLESSIARLNRLHVHAASQAKGALAQTKTQRLVESIAKQSQLLLSEAAAIKIQRAWRSYQSLSFVRRVYRRRQRLSRQLQLELQQLSWIGNRLLDEACIRIATAIAIEADRQVQQTLLRRRYTRAGID